MALLRELLTEIEYACVRGTLDREVTDIIYDSRQVVPGSMFVCLPDTGSRRRRWKPVRGYCLWRRRWSLRQRRM